MNFTISKNKFYDSLQDVSHAISSTTPLPALKGIKMQVTQDNGLHARSPGRARFEARRPIARDARGTWL